MSDTTKDRLAKIVEKHAACGCPRAALVDALLAAGVTLPEPEPEWRHRETDGVWIVEQRDRRAWSWRATVPTESAAREYVARKLAKPLDVEALIHAADDEYWSGPGTHEQAMRRAVRRVLELAQVGTVARTLATTEKWTDRNGEKQEATEWHRLVAFAKLAEVCAQYLKKGRLIYIEGRLQTRTWQAQDGQKRYSTEVIVMNMKMLGSDPNRSRETTPARGDDYEHPGAEGAPDEDIPF